MRPSTDESTLIKALCHSSGERGQTTFLFLCTVKIKVLTWAQIRGILWMSHSHREQVIWIKYIPVGRKTIFKSLFNLKDKFSWIDFHFCSSSKQISHVYFQKNVPLVNLFSWNISRNNVLICNVMGSKLFCLFSCSPRHQQLPSKRH